MIIDREIIPVTVVMLVILVSVAHLLIRFWQRRNWVVLGAAIARIYLLIAYIWVWSATPELAQSAFWIRAGVVLVFSVDSINGLIGSLAHMLDRRKWYSEWEAIWREQNQNES